MNSAPLNLELLLLCYGGAWLGNARFARNEEQGNSWTAHCRGKQVGALIAPPTPTQPVAGLVGKVQARVGVLFKSPLSPSDPRGQ